MTKISRSRAIVLIAGIVVIALSLLLFLSAMSLRDFSQPGQDLMSGRSNARLAAAYALMTGLALALLVLIGRAASGVSRPGVKPAAKRSPAAEGSAHSSDGPGGIISDTAGELRTTVHVLQEELEEIIDDEVPADKEHMHLLYEETDRLAKIIDSMEQLSRAEALARAPRQETVQIEPLLSGIIEQTRLAVADRDVTYTLACEPGLVMRGDPECLSRIIGNITDNAARSIKGSGTVKVTAGRSGSAVVFSVSDTGSGIRRAHLSHIYERFFRGTGSGIGMGLSIVKALVDSAGGKIEVQTEAGKGTTFTVQLPEA